MKTLRELMTDEIHRYGWLDFCFKRGDDNAASFYEYRDWLNSLSDADFLSRYNDVRESISNLNDF